MSYYQRDEETESLLSYAPSTTVDKKLNETSTPSVFGRLSRIILLVAAIVVGVIVFSYSKSIEKANPTPAKLLSVPSRKYFSALGNKDVLDLWNEFKLKFNKKVSSRIYFVLHLVS